MYYSGPSWPFSTIQAPVASVFSAEPCRHWLSQQEVHAPCVFSDLSPPPHLCPSLLDTLTTCCSKLSIFLPLPARLPFRHLPPAAGSSLCQLCALRGPPAAAPALCLLRPPSSPGPLSPLPSSRIVPQAFPECRAPEPTTGVPPGPSLGAFLRLNCYPQYSRGQLARLPRLAMPAWSGMVPGGSWDQEEQQRRMSQKKQGRRGCRVFYRQGAEAQGEGVGSGLGRVTVRPAVRNALCLLPEVGWG